MASNGAQGEQLIASQLTAQGWHIWARNFRVIGGELDIVAQKGRTLAVVEVKERQRAFARFGKIADLLPPRKQQALQRGALRFLEHHPEADFDHVRFDLALVVLENQRAIKVEYFTNVLESNGD